MAAISTELKGMRDIYTGNSQANALSFLVKMMLAEVNTALPVRVISATADGHGEPAGRVSVKSLICQRDGYNNALPMAEMFELPYMRYQGGKVAVICDPMPGDIGLAVFAQRDSSNVQAGIAASVQAGSFRAFDMADGFYIGGFLNQPPEVWIELMQDGNIEINAPAKVKIVSPEVEITGHLTIGNGVTNGGDVLSSNGIVLDTHTHTCPDGATSPPNG